MADEEVQYNDLDEAEAAKSDHIGWPLIFIKKSSAPMMPKPSIWERIFTTTYATIDTIGAPGDKMPRERERSFLP